jgi:hypothetical protein
MGSKSGYKNDNNINWDDKWSLIINIVQVLFVTMVYAYRSFLSKMFAKIRYTSMSLPIT